MNRHHGAPDGGENLRDRFEEVAPVIVVDPESIVRRGRRRRAIARTGTGLGVVAVVVAVLLLMRPGGGAPGPVAAEPPPEPERPVALEVMPAVVGPGDVVTAVLVASEPNDLTFGIATRVDRWDGREWRKAGETALCLEEWGCLGTVTNRLDGVEDIGLGAAPGSPGPATLLSTDGLAEGWYRLVQRAALDEGIATGVFEVRTGASAAPPRPPQGDVRLTLDPPAVRPEGDLVRVVTQVPAGPDGTLTAEEIEQADDALSRSASVQRWDGTQWLDVVEVDVQERAADLGVEWGSPVELPALPEGSYRLVRTRADGTEAWGVFAVSPRPALPSTEEEPGADAWAPDHPRCAEQPGRCLLEAWWRDVVAAAGIERGGGDHDLGTVLTDSVAARYSELPRER